MAGLEFYRETLQDIDASLQREWLETDGLGGFSSSTILGVNTRRYHGLLTAATNPPLGRVLLLSKFEETVRKDGRHYDLGANRYPGVIYPRGFEYLESFRLSPFPTFTYRIGDLRLEKRILMCHGTSAVIVQYSVKGGSCTLELRPLIAFREYHSLMRHNDAIRPEPQIAEEVVSMTPYDGLPTLYLGHNAAAVERTGNWYYNFVYDREAERGLECREDLFNPVQFRFELHSDEVATIVASTMAIRAEESGRLVERELERRRKVAVGAPSDDAFIRRLTTAADQFIVERRELQSVIAGYHWFSDWGRDAMISLPGLTLVTGRFDVARNILLGFAGAIDQGMLPNRYPDGGTAPDYNTVDATLWFFEAARAYLAWTGDVNFVLRELYLQLTEIVEWHVRGTRFGIKVDDDGLLHCGAPGSQLTWMDVKIGDRAVTPRIGKPVEVQALWYNALRIMQHLAYLAEDPADLQYDQMADLAYQSFNEKFWKEKGRCLYDVIDGELRDESVRPNQVFAISLHHPVLDRMRWNCVLDRVMKELWTPVGLRSLSPRDPAYRCVYEGDARSRDCAYHQGTVWPWLMGPFLSAYVKSHCSESAKAQAADWLRAFDAQMMTYGLGQIAEIADGDAPHRLRGCIAQAWSVGELLRAAVEDVFDLRSSPELVSVV